MSQTADVTVQGGAYGGEDKPQFVVMWCVVTGCDRQVHGKNTSIHRDNQRPNKYQDLLGNEESTKQEAQCCCQRWGSQLSSVQLRVPACKQHSPRYSYKE